MSDGVSDRKHTKEEIRDYMRYSANRSRDLADEMARWRGGCDDPMHPFMPCGDPQEFRDWHDFFTERACRPLVESEDPAEIQAAMALYRKANPHWIAVSLVMALNRIQALEAAEGAS